MPMYNLIQKEMFFSVDTNEQTSVINLKKFSSLRLFSRFSFPPLFALIKWLEMNRDYSNRAYNTRSDDVSL